MSVEFDSGSFTTNGLMPSKVTEFVLDRTVDIVLGLQVDQNDDGFFLALMLRTPGGIPEGVKTSAASFAVGTSLEIRFDAVPAGIYSIVLQPLGGVVAGTYRARWENILGGALEADGFPVSLPAESNFEEFEPISQAPDAQAVPLVPVGP
ncbi:hypothetical protein [Nocardia xishanensis]|uniref:hypothetical protein n=1 Tax=Nocardia xishanensis TaxID=238964 RepID=UPI000AD96B15|nr:hypothetical protein [Nocardia xishanensis]